MHFRFRTIQLLIETDLTTPVELFQRYYKALLQRAEIKDLLSNQICRRQLVQSLNIENSSFTVSITAKIIDMIERFYFANLMPLLIRDTTELCNSPCAGSQGKSPEALKQCMAARGEWILPPTLNTTKQHKEAVVLPTCIE